MNKNLFLIFLLVLPITMFGQFSKAYMEMKADENVEYKKYEPVLFKASEYIFENANKKILSNYLNKMQTDAKTVRDKNKPAHFATNEYIPVPENYMEFIFATKIVRFWLNKDIDVEIPTFGKFFKSLTNKNNQRYIYSIAMLNYTLNQKINHDRVLKCEKNNGQKYNELNDVSEVQLGGAKILLEYIGNKSNNLPIKSRTKKYLKAYKEGKLDEIFLTNKSE